MSKPRNRLFESLAQRGVPALLRLACALGLLALAIIVLPLVVPNALTLVGSMVVGHALGLTAAGLYVLAVFLDLARSRDS